MGDGRRHNQGSHQQTTEEREMRHADVRRYKIDANQEYKARNEFITRVERASAHHPEIDQQVFRDIIAAYDTEHDAYSAKEIEIRKSTPESDLKTRMQEARAEVLKNIEGHIEKHGPAATAAMHAVAAENQPESFFTPLVRMVYNSDKGGLQLGGLGGAAALGGLAYYFSSSAGTSSLLTWGITAAATLLGAYAGSQAFPGKDSVQTPNFKTPVPSRSPVKTPEITVDSPELQTKRTTPMPDVRVDGAQIKPIELTGFETTSFTPQGGPKDLPPKPRQI